MVCPMGYKFTICRDVNGCFLGVKVDDIVKCRVTDYVPYESDIFLADELQLPEPICCEQGHTCLGKEVNLCRKNGVS